MYAKKGRTRRHPNSRKLEGVGRVAHSAAASTDFHSGSLLAYLLPPRTVVEVVDSGDYGEAVRRLRSAVLSGLAQRAELWTDKSEAQVALAEMACQRLPGVVCDLTGQPLYEVRLSQVARGREN